MSIAPDDPVLRTQNQDEQQLIEQRRIQRERDLEPPTDDEAEREKRRLRFERQMLPDRLSVVVQGRTVRAEISPQHFEETVLLPGFTVDDARKLKGGEGAQFRTDAVKMVEVETARVAQLHEIVGVSDIWLACDGVIMDPVDWASLDEALALAQAQVIAGVDEGDSDVKEIAVVSAALMETARYQAVEGPEQAPPPPEGGALEGRRDDDNYRDPDGVLPGGLPAEGGLPRDPPIGQTAEPQWRTGE